jgi:hypothetical protein
MYDGEHMLISTRQEYAMRQFRGAMQQTVGQQATVTEVVAGDGFNQEAWKAAGVDAELFKALLMSNLRDPAVQVAIHQAAENGAEVVAIVTTPAVSPGRVLVAAVGVVVGIGLMAGAINILDNAINGGSGRDE